MPNINLIFRIMLLLSAITIVFATGYYSGSNHRYARSLFDDVLLNHPQDLMELINKQDKRVAALAVELKTPQNAYLYVRDSLQDDPSQSVLPPGETISAGRASCLGKALLLVSLYRALGFPSSSVRVITGEVSIPTGIFDHAWIDIEYNGGHIQQDATKILGSFSFDQFRGDAYTQSYVRDEEFVFNDTHFAIVSQLNQFKGQKHPAVQ